MKTDTSGYFMDDPREATRLARKVDARVWVETFLSAELALARRVLDVGCGPGAILSEVSRRAPGAEVVGIDMSAERVSVANRAVADLTSAHAKVAEASALPFDDGQFDLVYCRFLLQYLKDKEAAVREMVRVCVPGGKIVLQDLDGQLLWHYPIDTTLLNVIERIVGELQRDGFDPFVGRKLYYFAKSSGLSEIGVDVRPYHLVVGRIEDAALSQWNLKLDIALRAIAKATGSEDRARRLIERFREHLLNEETLTYSVLFTVRGTKA